MGLVQSAENLADANGSLAITFGASNVTAGNFVTFCVSRYTQAATDAIVVGDLAKTAGTSTIGTIVLDAQAHNSSDGGAEQGIAIFSVPITGTGTLTLTCTGNGGDYWWGSMEEWTGYDQAREDTASGTGSSTTPTSGDATSAGAALFVAIVGTNAGGAITIAEDAAFTPLHEELAGNLHSTGSTMYDEVASGTTQDADYTLGSTEEWACGLAVYPATGGGGGGLSIPIAAMHYQKMMAQN